jgi:hypothetical protein
MFDDVTPETWRTWVLNQPMDIWAGRFHDIRRLLREIQFEAMESTEAAAWPRFHTRPFGANGMIHQGMIHSSTAVGANGHYEVIHWTSNFEEVDIADVRNALQKLRREDPSRASFAVEFDEIPLINLPELVASPSRIVTAIMGGNVPGISRRTYCVLYTGSTAMVSQVRLFMREGWRGPKVNSVNFTLEAIGAVFRSQKGKVKVDFKKVLIKYAIQHEGYPTFKVAFKGVRGDGSSAALEKKSVKVMRPPLNSNIAGGGHESHCFVYYVFMSKAFQVFWRANTTLQAGARKQRLLKELLNKY